MLACAVVAGESFCARRLPCMSPAVDRAVTRACVYVRGGGRSCSRALPHSQAIHALRLARAAAARIGCSCSLLLDVGSATYRHPTGALPVHSITLDGTDKDRAHPHSILRRRATNMHTNHCWQGTLAMASTRSSSNISILQHPQLSLLSHVDVSRQSVVGYSISSHSKLTAVPGTRSS